jgi:hypothetical protein
MEKVNERFLSSQYPLSCPVTAADGTKLNTSFTLIPETQFLLDFSNYSSLVALLVSINLMYVLAVGLFIYLRGTNEIAQRRVLLNFINACCSVITTTYAISSLEAFEFGYAALPCVVEVWVALLVMPMNMMCYFLRAVHLIVQFTKNQDGLQKPVSTFHPKLAFKLDKMTNFMGSFVNIMGSKGDNSVLRKGSFNDVRQENAKASSRLSSKSVVSLPRNGSVTEVKQDMRSSLRLSNKSGSKSKSFTDFREDNMRHSRTSSNSDNALPGKHSETDLKAEATKTSSFPLSSKVFQLTSKYSWWAMGFMFLICLIIQIVIHSTFEGMSLATLQYPRFLLKEDINNQRDVDYWKQHARLLCLSGCLTASTPVVNILVPFYAFCMIFMIYSMWVLRKVREDLYLKHEILLYLIVEVPLILCDAITAYMESAESGKLSHANDKSVSTMEAVNRALHVFQGIWGFVVSIVFPVCLALWRQKPSTHLELSTKSFSATLLDKKQFQRFKKCLAQQLCIENGLFCEEFMSVCKRVLPALEDVTPSVLNEALIAHQTSNPIVSDDIAQYVKKLYAEYIGESAKYELNIPGNIRKALKQDIDKDNCHPAVLAGVWKTIYSHMYDNSFREFLKERSDGMSYARRATIVV